MKRTALFFLLAPVVAMPSLAFADAPFGLTWGMSKVEVEDLGVTLLDGNKERNLEIYQANELPIDLSNAEFYSLIFDENQGLQKVTMVSDTISSDAYGREGKSAYDRIKTALTDKYGAPSNDYNFIGLKLWDEPDEFYQCLAYDGCGGWASFFENNETGEVTALTLRGLRRGEGYLTLAYEGPGWAAALDEKDEAVEFQDRDAL